VEFVCPSNGVLHPVWGSNPYTDDSSICSAAVHAGLITMRHGGHVLVEIRPGQKAYIGNLRHGVTSLGYGKWQGSYVFPQAGLNLPGEEPPLPDLHDVTWHTTAGSLRGRDGMHFPVACPPGGSPGSVWGSNPYTDDSSVCTAGVHAGVISLEVGGTVTIEIAPGARVYRGCLRNGVRTHSWGRYSGSFRVKDGLAGCGSLVEVDGSQAAIEWQTRATDLYGEPGQRFVLHCPPGGHAYTVWGNNPYTDDSSICTAAVHAGAIVLDAGGKVEVEIRPGEPSYKGSLRNGVQSGQWSEWGGSFVVRTGGR